MEPWLAPSLLLDPYFGVEGDLRLPPTEFRLFPAGAFLTEKGEFLFDEEAAGKVMEGWGRRQVDLTMDYEHQALHDPPIEAPASCRSWVPQIRNGELWATECKWTDRAAGYLRAGEYRYFSPAFHYEPEAPHRITEVLNVALTNIPAMRGIAPLVAASRREISKEKEPDMDYEKLYKELIALHETQTAELSAIKKQNEELTAKLSTNGAEATVELEAVAATLSLPRTAGAGDRSNALAALTSLRSNVRSLTGAASDASAVGTIHSWKASHEAVAALSTRVVELEDAAIVREFDALLDAAKLAPAKRTELRATALNMNKGRLTKEAIEFARVSLSMSTRVPEGTVGQPEPRAGTVDTETKPTTVEGLHPMQVHIATLSGRDPKQLVNQGK